jgi:hypothetical protein
VTNRSQAEYELYLPRSIKCCLVAILFACGPLHVALGAGQSRTALSPVMERLRNEHQHILDELNTKDADGKLMELDNPRVPALLREGWDVAGQWAAAYLEVHTTASRRDLVGIFDGFAPAPRGVKSQFGDFLEYSEYSLSGSAIRIGPSVYVVEASYGVEFPTGTFMVVARGRDGHFHALWNIKDLAEKHYAQRDEIGRWMHLVRRAYYNGPLTVSRILPVYASTKGHARFLVDAYQGADGGTILGQLSIWEWDGSEAKPLLVEAYEYAADFGGLQFDGKMVRISTKGELNAFFSCGMCPEPRSVWKVRITADGIEDLGHQFLQPEIAWADELLSRINRGEGVTDIAEERVARILTARVREGQTDAADRAQPSDQSAVSFSWGMLGSYRILSRGQRGAFVLAVDEAELHFSYILRRGRPYFTNVEVK